MEKNLWPDWYPAPIHQRELSIQEWATEIYYRVVGLCMVHDGWKSEIGKQTFKNIVLNLYGNHRRDEATQYIPVGHENFPEAVNFIDYYGVTPDFWKREKHRDKWVNCEAAFPANFIVPIFINTHFDEKTILSEVKRVIAEHKKALAPNPAHAVKGIITDYKKNNSLRSIEDETDLVAEYRRNHMLQPMDNVILETLANSPFSSGKITPSAKQAIEGKLPYGVNHVAIWNEYKVLDFIDLTLWGMLSDIEYEDKYLCRKFWDDPNMTNDNIRTTTKRWAFELLHPSGSDRLSASAYANEKIKSRS